ncbi:MAG: HD domain-containing protein [Candidatus Aenigmatarchaeota archaeon]
MDRLGKIKEISKDYMEELEDPAHNWHHIQRVYNLCERIWKEEGADLEVLRVGALMHDIGLTENREKHGIIGANLAEDILKDLDYNREFIDHVTDVIRSHRFSNEYEPESIEAKILRDADELDALGAIGIARVMYVSQRHGKEIHDPEREIDDELDGISNTAIMHFYEKLLKLKENVETETAREIAEERHEYMEDYLERFFDEWEGKK